MVVIDWWDITLHVAVAAIFAGALGHGAGVMLRQGRWYHKAGAISFALAAIIGISIFWISREQGQHGGHIGGLQSQLEWIVPALFAPVIFGVSAWVSKSRH